MARRRYYRRSARVIVPKKKWATNIVSSSISTTAAAQTNDSAYFVLAQNSSQSATPTPFVVKTGNFKIQGDCYITSQAPIGSTSQITLYVMYLPEVVYSTVSAPNVNILGTVIGDHPEWIMGWKVIDLNVGGTTSNGNSFTFSSRLKRNLSSGDRIVLAAVIRNGQTVSADVTIN